MYFLITTSIHSDSIELIALPERQQVCCEEQIHVETKIEDTLSSKTNHRIELNSDSSDNAWLNEMNDFDRF